MKILKGKDGGKRNTKLAFLPLNCFLSAQKKATDAAFQVQLLVLTPRPMPFQLCLSNLSDIWIVKDSDDDSSEHTVLYFFSLNMSKIIYGRFLTYIHTVHMLKL